MANTELIAKIQTLIFATFSFTKSTNSFGYSPFIEGSKKLLFANSSAILAAFTSASLLLLGYAGVKFNTIPILPLCLPSLKYLIAF